MPVIFFGTPSTAEHEKRAKYERRLRERRVLRRDSLDLARRRTMTAVELQATLPQAPLSGSSQAQDGSDRDSQQLPETPERHSASSRVSTPGSERKEGDEEQQSCLTLMEQAEHSEETAVTANMEQEGEEDSTDADSNHQSIDAPPGETIASEYSRSHRFSAEHTLTLSDLFR